MSQYKKPSPAPLPASELRQRVYTSIDKLSDRATLSQAYSDLEFIARNLPSDSLSSFLSYILSVDASSKSPVRVHCINLLSVLAKTPHHSSTLSNLVPKTVLPALLRRLRDPDSAVRTACVAAVAALSPVVGFGSLVGPLIGSVMTEQDLNGQIGSCLCLKAAIDFAADVDGGDEAELRRVVPKMLKMVRGDFFKAKGALLGVIGSVVGVNEGGVVNGRNGLVGNVVGVAVEMLSSEDWAARKAATEVLEVVAVVAEQEAIKEVKRVVVNALESRRFDKVKITRETMNRVLEIWKEVPGGPEEDLLLSRSNSTISKDNGSCRSSPSVSRRSSFAGWETPKPRKTITKTRSSLSDGPVASIASPISTSTRDSIGLETPPQRKKTLSKSRSSLSDDSTITDSSSVSHDVGFETPQSKKSTTKNRSSLPDDFAASVMKKKNASRGNDGKLEVALPPIPSAKVVLEEEMQSNCRTVEVTTSGSEMRSNFYKKTSEERVQKGGGLRSGSRVVPFIEVEESQELVVEGGANEEVGESNADVELSLIRNQLLQIEKQQSNLLDLLQRFMGNSQNGIDSLETRVSGLERALDEISYDLAVQSGRIPKNESAGSTCCPSTEFLSPKFWKRTEGRPSTTPKSSYFGSVPNKDGNVEAVKIEGHRLHEQNEGICRDSSWGNVEFNTTKSMKSIGQNAQRGRTCSPRSFDAASTAPYITPVVRGV